MIHQLGGLVDIDGNLIPDGEDRKRAEEELKEYIEKHKRRFEDFFRENGPVRPPLKYNLSRREWLWLE